MAAKRTNHWKIGLFVLAGVAAAVVGLFWGGIQSLNRARVERVTYFDESVQGLDVGAPVKMRGVTIGVVTDITLAPDRRLVKVTADVYVDLWEGIGLGTESELRSGTRGLPPDLRVQLTNTGITGEKILVADFFPRAGPPPELEVTPYNYIPSTPSTLKSLEEGLTIVADLLPKTLEQLEHLAATVDDKVGAVDTATLSADLSNLLQRTEGTLAELDVAGLRADVRGLVDRLGETAARADVFLERLEAEDGPLRRFGGEVEGVVGRAGDVLESLDSAVAGADLPGTAASLRETSDAYRPMAREATVLAVELRDTLARMREALVSVQALAAMLERQPGALLRGHPTEFPPGDGQR